MPGSCLTNIFSISSLRELRDLMREPRDLSAGIILMDDVALREKFAALQPDHLLRGKLQ